MSWIRNFVLFAVMLFAAASIAQGQESGKPDQGNLHITMDNPKMALGVLACEWVQNEIRLTKEQKRKLQPLPDELSQESARIDEHWRNLPAEQRTDEAFMRAHDQAVAATQTKLEAILLSDQIHRLEEIMFQLIGSAIFLEPDIAAALGLSDIQQEAHMRILDVKRRAIQSILPGPEVNLFLMDAREQYKLRLKISEKEHQLEADAMTNSLNVLTPRQKMLFHEMKGKDVNVKVVANQRIANTYRDQTSPPELTPGAGGSIPPIRR